MNLLGMGIGEIIGGIGKIADDLHTSDEELLKIALQEKTIDAGIARGQMEVNKAEAGHKSIFVAGWRPFIGWVGGFAMVYQFIGYPMMLWGWSLLQANGIVPADLSPPPMIDGSNLWPIVTGMLGIGGMRSFDKAKKTQTDKI